MKISSDASFLRQTHEGITKFASMSDFDKKSIQEFPNTCNNSMPTIDADAFNNIGAESAVSGANMSSISVSRRVAAVNAAKHCGAIARVMNSQQHELINSLSCLQGRARCVSLCER